MNVVNINQQSSIEAFKSNFHYAWKTNAPRFSVEHYVVNWAIEKLQLLFLEEHKSVTSPEFVLNSSNTAWSFEIFPNGLCNAAQYIDILIKRSGRLGPKNVGLTYRFGVIKTDGNTAWLEGKKVVNFVKNSFRKKSIKEERLRKELSEDKFKYGEVFKITCEMYVKYAVDGVDADSLEAADHDLVNFAFDMTKLMNAVEVTDFTLHTPNCTARTHKAILAARSTAVRTALNNNCLTTEVRFQGLFTDNFRTVLYYIYSGNLDSALGNKLPEIGLYESAQIMGVSDLMELLSPGRQNFRSVLQSQELSFTWVVTDFLKRCKSGTVCIKSQGFSQPFPGSPKWHLITEFNKDSNKLGVFIETTGDDKSVHHSILKISLLDGNDGIINTNLTTRFVRPGNRFGFPDFLSDFSDQNLKYELLVDDTLRVHCELLFVVSTDLHESHEFLTSHQSSPVDTYRTLANDVHQLLKTGAYSDLTLRAQDGSVLAVHKSILFARSRRFHSKILYYNKGEKNLDVFDVEPHLLRVMIEHAYSGTLQPMSAVDMLMVHKAADAYVFRQLTLVTLHHLAFQINFENVFELLKEGRRLQDRYLYEKCLLFVRDNSMKIMKWTNWEQFRRDFPDLCDVVVEQLNQVTSGN